MGFNDLFERDQHHNSHGHDHRYGNDNYNQRSQSHNRQNDIQQLILNKLRNNPKLKGLLIMAAMILIVVVVFAVILLFPFLLKIFNYISANGVQGLIDSFWNGTKK
jgi:hypothetical protein